MKDKHESKALSPPVINAATLVCLRRRLNASGLIKWQVLLGQNETINWLRSTRDQTVIMRYPGEWKFPGGGVEAQDSTFADTALRELNEEFLGISAPTDGSSLIHLLNTKMTLVVKGKRYCMHNFVAFEDENAWLQQVNIDEINQKLCERKQSFEQKLKDGTFWSLTPTEKALYSPETYRVNWIELDQAITMMDTTSAPYVDQWQKQQFQFYGIVTRDPMYQSQSVLLEIQDLGTKDAIQHKATMFQNSSLNTADK